MYLFLPDSIPMDKVLNYYSTYVTYIKPIDIRQYFFTATPDTVIMEHIIVLDWSSWNHWSYCDVKCGGGIKKRYRKCIGKGFCHGSSWEQAKCNMHPCPCMYFMSVCVFVCLESFN